MKLHHFQVQNDPFARNTFFEKTIKYNFHVPLGLFHYTKVKENPYSGSRVMRMHYFWAQNHPLAPNENFFRKTINIIFMYLLAPFIVQKFKKILRADLGLCGCTIFRPKMACLPRKRFSSENTLVKLVVFIHVYLYAKNQSLMSLHL